MTAHAVGLNETQDFDLLLLVLGTDRAGGNRLQATLIFSQQDEMVTDRRMRNVGGGVAVGRQFLEIRAPLFWHSIRIVQVELIKLFHIGSISTG